jgi:hypothetical protein
MVKGELKQQSEKDLMAEEKKQEDEVGESKIDTSVDDQRINIKTKRVMATKEDLENNLQETYNEFYKKLKLTENKCKGKRKFQNNIRMGSNYINWKPKILIVGLDAGSDNDKPLGKIKCEEKIKIIVDGKVNPHMSGVYGTVLFFQKEDKWQRQKEDLLKSKTFQSFIKDTAKISDDLLSSFAVVNFYSFVTIKREKAAGGKDRLFVKKDIEIQHLIDVINTINPDIIVVQSTSLKKYFENIKGKIENESTEIYIGYHPATFGRNIKYRNPKLYFEKLQLLKEKK